MIRIIQLILARLKRNKLWDSLNYGKPSNTGDDEWHRMNGER